MPDGGGGGRAPARPARRIGFANQLRGVAVLCVAVAHLLAVYWTQPGLVSFVTATPAPDGVAPAALVVATQPWFNFGPFGVALFFLISGLVIPFSFRTHGARGFALARLLRIYPTYALAFLAQAALVYGASRYWGTVPPAPPRVVVANALLLNDLVGYPSLDLVNWTLAVELAFYVLALLLRPALVAGRMGPVLLAAVLLVAVGAAAAPGAAGHPFTVRYTLSRDAVCLGYMLIGVAFNFHHRGLLPGGRLLACVAVLTGLFLLSWRLSVWAADMPLVTVNYLYALGLFAALYAARDRVPRVPGLDALAAISFPFYVLHSITGYSALRLLTVRFGWTYWPALAATLGGLGAACWLLHVLVERPTIRAGHRLGRLRPGRAAPAATSR